jgi:NAD(P)-dependent dehydrogenase (short-subunit alcohol dehydrogenase family)
MTEARVALVTGANKGIGREIARQLAALGCRVWLGARNHDLGAAAVAALRAEGGDVHHLKLDVTDNESVCAAAARVAEHADRLDILVNNAGIAMDAGALPSELDLRRMQAMYEVNVFGAVRVTQAFLPLLRAAPAGRVVMMSSGLGSLGNQSDPTYEFVGYNSLGYNSSKAALNAVTVVFAKELAGTFIKVNAADPGRTATDLNQHRGPRSVAQGAAIAIRLATLPPDGPTGGFFNDSGRVNW